MIVARRVPLVAALVALVATLAPAAGSAQTPGPCGSHHVVGAGDTLARIADRCGITVPALLAANPAVRASEDLRVGGHVRIPAADAAQPTPQEACGAFYTVRTGDTLDGIARKCGLTVPLILAANGPLPDPLNIGARRILRIPDLPPGAITAATTLAVVPPPDLAPDPDVEPDTAPTAPVQLTRVEGTLAAGGRCMRLRTDDGRVYALDGRIGQAYRAGQRVVALGLPGDADRCGHSPTLELRIIHRPGD